MAAGVYLAGSPGKTKEVLSASFRNPHHPFPFARKPAAPFILPILIILSYSLLFFLIHPILLPTAAGVYRRRFARQPGQGVPVKGQGSAFTVFLSFDCLFIIGVRAKDPSKSIPDCFLGSGDWRLSSSVIRPFFYSDWFAQEKKRQAGNPACLSEIVVRRAGIEPATL